MQSSTNLFVRNILAVVIIVVVLVAASIVVPQIVAEAQSMQASLGL